ncbi:Predicted alpha-1,6-mannanase, GH76 family [Pedobacter hartonius]|uniref:Predicted alpha-1,6-mannanase, GH76 family n=2 Tax=Pedobacter hartonius TaxID=425514 RepID=A0A1H3WT85_9SPHI|nr:Predicted alpha-1,6-mannanase, GH76 family [Pedobacter hartonius]
MMACSISSCSKKATEVTEPSALLTKKQLFTPADATAAFHSFNNIYYSSTDKLYYATTERNSIGAIWTQAIYWDMVMNAYQRTKDPADLKMINDIYTGGFNRYDGYNWNNTTTWFIYDDMMWWVIALTNAYQITGNTVYLDKAKAGFDRVWNGSYDPVAGGMFWDFQHSGKNSCINYPTVIAAMKLYAVTKNEAYFTKATSIYAWSRANLFDTNSGRVADNKIGNVPGYADYTYNYGTCIGSAMALYKATGTQSYLADAKLCANYVKNTMSDSNGILPAEGDFNEQGVLKAILAQYLIQLLPEDTSGQYATWIDNNINTAWQNRDQSRGIMHRNYKIPCPTGIVQSYESSSAVAFMQLFNPI